MAKMSEKEAQELKPIKEKSKHLPSTVSASNEKKDEASAESQQPGAHEMGVHHPTSYGETLVHLIKGNIGPGLFAMGDAFKNSGIIVGPILTVIIAVISVHCQHLLLGCSMKMQQLTKTTTYPDFAETVELCFANGPPKLRWVAPRMKTIVNIFICVTQLGFCCIYFVFISTNIKQILDFYDLVIDVHLLMVIIFIPILLPSLLTHLKFLAPISMIANVCIISGVIITMYFALKDGVPSPSERNYFASWEQLALYFGTAIFAFEGIALVLPLKNEMRSPNQFDRPLGVLNTGMFTVSTMFICAGFLGYLRWGENVGGSLTLNLDVSNWLAQLVKVVVSLGVLLGYALQFFVAIQIMWPSIESRLTVRLTKHKLLAELLFRTFMVLITFGIAELVPKLNLFISLIGALCSTTLALVFPPLIELIVSWENSKGSGAWIFFKNIFILLLALVGFSTGSYESISSIVKEFKKT